MRALAEEACLCADQQPAPIVGEADLVHLGLGDRDATSGFERIDVEGDKVWRQHAQWPLTSRHPGWRDGPLTLEVRDVGLVLQREPDVVQAIHQTVAAERIELEG